MILLEEESLLKLIVNHKLATQAREEWKNKQSDSGGKGEEEENETVEDVAEGKKEKTEEVSNNKNNAEEIIVSGIKGLDINKDQSEKIHARTLYVVPPKQTRRRGEKPGNVYLVLTTPPISAAVVEQPPPPIEEVPPVNAEVEANGNNGTQTEEGKTAEVVPPVVPPKVDYSRQIAERQLALVRSLEIMTALAAEDGKGGQVWAGCQVEESSNGKSWRPPQRKDHREGTVQDSPGFKAFMEMTAKEKEDLQSRPKPAPGGGLSALSTGGLSGTGDGTTDNNGKPVAALVLHLQSKREQEKSQKKNKRKAKDTKKKTGGPNETNNGNTTTAAGGAAAKKRGRQRKNKKGAMLAKKAADSKP